MERWRTKSLYISLTKLWIVVSRLRILFNTTGRSPFKKLGFHFYLICIIFSLKKHVHGYDFTKKKKCAWLWIMKTLEQFILYVCIPISVSHVFLFLTFANKIKWQNTQIPKKKINQKTNVRGFIFLFRCISIIINIIFFC